MPYSNVLLWASALALCFGCARYEAPCAVGSADELAAFPASLAASYHLERLDGDRIQLLRTENKYIQVVERGSEVADGGATDGAAPSQFSAEADAVTLTREGELSARHKLSGLPSGSKVMVGEVLVNLWVEQTGAQLETLQPMLSMHDEHGLRAGPISVQGAACSDCEVQLGLRAMGDEALVLWSQKIKTEPRWQPGWIAFGTDGAPHANGSIDELGPEERVDLTRFSAQQRQDALIVQTTGGRAWLADSRLRLLTASLSSHDYEKWDWDAAHTRISRMWNADSPYGTSDILTDRIGFDGQSLLAEDRISVGAAAMIADAPASLGVVLFNMSGTWFAARGSDGVKLGGDVAFDISPIASVMIPIGPASFLLYSIESSDAGSELLRRRIVECRR